MIEPINPSSDERGEDARQIILNIRQMTTPTEVSVQIPNATPDCAP